MQKVTVIKGYMILIHQLIFYFHLAEHGKQKYISKATALRTRMAADNSAFEIGGLSSSAGSFVVAESSVHRMNICTEKIAHRKFTKQLW